MPKKLEGLKVPYKDAGGREISAEDQANKIIAAIQAKLDAGSKGVAITYSANERQAQAFYKGYSQNNDVAITSAMSGAGNQGKVFAEVYKAIIKNNWQSKVHILPIATSMTGGEDYNPANPSDTSNMATAAMADRDMQNIARHAGAGWDVMGMQNQKTAVNAFAVGGGYSVGWYNHPTAGQGNRVADLMKDMAQGKFDASLLQAAYDDGNKNGIKTLAVVPVPTSAKQDGKPINKKESTESATSKLAELPPTTMLSGFIKSLAKDTKKLQELTEEPAVMEGDSIKPEFMDRILQAVNNHIAQAQEEYEQIVFKKKSPKPKVGDGKAKDEIEAVGKNASGKATADEQDFDYAAEPEGFMTGEEVNKKIADKTFPEGTKVAKDEYYRADADHVANVTAEKAAMYKAILYRDLQVKKITSKDPGGEEVVDGYSLVKAGRKLLDVKMVVDGEHPKVSVSFNERSQDAMYLSLHTMFVHAQQAGIKQPSIKFQDVENPEYALAMLKTANEMGFNATIKPETVAKFSAEQQEKYATLVKGEDTLPAEKSEAIPDKNQDNKSDAKDTKDAKSDGEIEESSPSKVKPS